MATCRSNVPSGSSRVLRGIVTMFTLLVSRIPEGSDFRVIPAICPDSPPQDGDVVRDTPSLVPPTVEQPPEFVVSACGKHGKRQAESVGKPPRVLAVDLAFSRHHRRHHRLRAKAIHKVHLPQAALFHQVF